MEQAVGSGMVHVEGKFGMPERRKRHQKRLGKWFV
jgi:hypothetical protein